ncbi:MAG: acyltransferase [Methanobrevibacter sp.]|nr:acyltransferase [Methanobrevibacter sp.]
MNSKYNGGDNIKTRIAYYDNLRVLAIFGIIAIHVFQLWHHGEKVNGMYIYMFSEIVRYAVPIFLMLSGALLLNRDIDLNHFLKHRLTRITYPFLFFLIIAFLLSLFTDKTFSYNIFSHSWYFWMIFGVYLSIPIINKFIQHASVREIEYFLAVFIIASVFYQFILYYNVENYFNLNFFAAPIGFLVLGYYLSIRDFKIDSRKLIILMFAVFVIATSMKMLSTGAIMPKSFALNYEATQSAVLDSWVDVSIFAILQAGSLFVLMKHLNFTGFRKAIVSLSNLSYGMYLINSIIMFYITPFFVNLPRNGFEICIVIVLMSVFVFVVSWVMIWVLSKVPVVGKYCS